MFITLQVQTMTIHHWVPNRDGTFVMWRSDWGAKTGEVDSYIAGLTQTAPDNTPPTVSSGLFATAVSSGSFTLNWAASSDAVGVTGYDVYKDGILYVPLLLPLLLPSTAVLNPSLYKISDNCFIV